MISSRSLFALFALCPLLVVGSSPFDGFLAKKMDMEDYQDMMEGAGKEPEEVKLDFTSSLRAKPTEDDRNLLETCDSDVCTAAAVASLLNEDSDVGIYSGCGALANEKEGAFCDDPDVGRVCCGHGTEDCCDVNGGAVAGVIIAGIVVLVMAIFGCCFCCSCCCCYDNLHRRNREGDMQKSDTTATEVVPPKVEEMAT